MINVSFTYLVLTFALFFATNDDLPVSEVWDIDKSSSMVVIGETNVNSFECILGAYDWGNNLVCYSTQSPGSNKHRILCNFDIPINSFDCGIGMMTKDLRKTLKSDKHPFLNISLKEMSSLISNLKNGDLIDTKTDITLSGVKKASIIQFVVKKNNKNFISLEGKKTISLSDYNLSPPSKLLGSVKVKDEMVVNIKMKLKKIKTEV
ncbi:MAG: YceI family protein [Deltaproteobacteria bacterium]